MQGGFRTTRHFGRDGSDRADPREYNAAFRGPLAPGGLYRAELKADDPDRDSLEFQWVLMRESVATQEGGDAEPIPEALEGRIEPGTDGQALLAAPTEPGHYRLFAYVRDGQGNAGHANIPFRVGQK